MTATAHALVSGAIASVSPNPATAYALAFVSHFVLDTIPHWDFGTNWRSRSKSHTGAIAIADTLLGFTLTYFLFIGKVDALPLILAMIAGNLPDWMEAPYYIFFASQHKHEPGKDATFWEKLTYHVYRLESVFHAKAQFPLGAITQIVAVSFFLILLQR